MAFLLSCHRAKLMANAVCHPFNGSAMAASYHINILNRTCSSLFGQCIMKRLQGFLSFFPALLFLNPRVFLYHCAKVLVCAIVDFYIFINLYNQFIVSIQLLVTHWFGMPLGWADFFLSYYRFIIDQASGFNSAFVLARVCQSERKSFICQ